MQRGDTAASLSASAIDWNGVCRVLVVRLRSIGDTVLATPSLISLRKFLPDAEIDVLLEDWVAPLLDGFEYIDNIVIAGRTAVEKVRTAMDLLRRRYDVVFNLHGGTTSTFFTRATGARERVGYAEYRYSNVYNHLLSSSAEFWQKQFTHSAEQQMALLGSVGVPVSAETRSYLAVTENARASLAAKFLSAAGVSISDAGPLALIHPAAAFATKQWATSNFARVAEHLHSSGHQIAAVAAGHESAILQQLKEAASVPIATFSDLSLPEITALASHANIFVGNDSGIAHIAAAVNTPAVVVFGSSNRNHWHPWTDASNEMVFSEFPCQPCPGYECKVFGEPKCILSVPTESVIAAICRVLT